MRLTDAKAKKMLSRSRLYEVSESIYSYPEEEREGRDDFQMLADEAGYFLSCYHEDGHVFADDLQWARDILRETKYGKELHGRWQSDVDNAKNTVNEYNRLKRFVKRLEAMGYYSRWL